MKDFIQIEDIAELVKLNNNRSIKLFSDVNTYNINIAEFHRDNYIVYNYRFRQSYFEKSNSKEYHIIDKLQFIESDMTLVKDFLFFLKNHYKLLLSNHKFNTSSYKINDRLYQKYYNRKNYILIKNIGYKSNNIIKTSKFDYFIDDDNLRIIVSRVSENISDQKLKELVVGKSSAIVGQIDDFKRNADTYKRDIDRLEQSINFIETNYSELVI